MQINWTAFDLKKLKHILATRPIMIYAENSEITSSAAEVEGLNFKEEEKKH